jgi:hypothetical protein
MAWLAAALIVLFAVLGFLWYGISPVTHQRFWHDIAERAGGPMSFRFLLQPVMGGLAAIHDGINDARLDRSPYFWTVLHSREQRSSRLNETLTSTARIVLLGLAMDGIYQYRVFGKFYPGEAALIALLLAVVPYFIIRGPAERIARHWIRKAR